ncbi:MAG: ribosome silencing factor [Lentisphaerota bacterium]
MSKQTNFPTSEEFVNFCARLAEDKKAENVIVMKLGEVSSISDYFMICTGTSHPHLGAIAEWVRRKAREEFDIRPVAIDGEKESDWIVIDFGNVMLHIFSQESREKYNLESLWGDSEKIEKLITEKRSQK